jgi:hypothetical protein
MVRARHYTAAVEFLSRKLEKRSDRVSENAEAAGLPISLNMP